MDYSQKGQPLKTDQGFFTPGVGNTPENQNIFEPEDNLNLNNWSLERDHRNIGSKVIGSPENLGKDRELPDIPQEKVAQEELGEIAAELVPPEITPSVPAFNPNLIRTEGDRINGATLSEIDHVESKLKQTGNAADFYATIRGDDNNPGMMRGNLKNSFNREVA